MSDGVGVLRLGSPGNDVETRNRIVQVDPAGDDAYANNAGGTTLLEDLDPTTPDIAVAVSLDFAGNDAYAPTQRDNDLGAGNLGVGVAVDYEGDDGYACRSKCLGMGLAGVGFFRDASGNDVFTGSEYGMGSASLLGVFVDNAGNDAHNFSGTSGGFGVQNSRAIGLAWDRAGMDSYEIRHRLDYKLYGWNLIAGRGWFVDEGTELDEYATSTVPSTHAHGCNDCAWQGGEPTGANHALGRGYDDRGGLAALLSEEDFTES